MTRQSSYDRLRIYSRQEARHDLVVLTQRLDEYIRQNGIHNLVLIDRSARPAATALIARWKQVGAPSPKPKIYFVNPTGFQSREYLNKNRRAQNSILASVMAGQEADETMQFHRDSFDYKPEGIPLRDQTVMKAFVQKMPVLFKDRNEKTLIFDTCVHTGESLSSLVRIFKRLGFSQMKVGVVSTRGAKKDSFVPDFTFDESCKDKNCYPFGNETLVTKRNAIVCEPVTPNHAIDRIRVQNARALRSGIKEVISKNT